MNTFKSIILLFFCIVPFGIRATECAVESPDGKVKIIFTTGLFEGQEMVNPTNIPFYQVFYEGKAFVQPSRMGIILDGMPPLTAHFSVTNINIREYRNMWKPVYGEKEIYPDSCNELIIDLQETIPPERKLRIVFRAYNEGVAFRYEIPSQQGLHQFRVLEENTEYTFDEGTYVWEEHGHEGLYFKKQPYEIEPDCELPLTVQTNNGIYGAIAEANALDYPRAYIDPVRPRNRKSNTLRIALRSNAQAATPFNTRWRTITLGNCAGDLMENNYLLLNLNDPCEFTDTSWIKPGKAFREVTQTTENGLKAIDFAVKQGVDYIIFDWGWYGPHNDESNEPSTVNVVATGTGKPIPGHTGLDLQRVIDYGKSKNVGIFLYVNRQGLERYMDVIFPLYKSWGIAGVKAGFVQVGSQGWNKWNEEVVRKAAEYQLLVNIHDAYRPTGFSRTYPNLLTQEGIHGNEQNPDANHSTTLPFVRFTIGAADFTPGYFKKALKTSWAHKLSLPIIFYSPAQFLFWGERLEDIESQPELDLWKNMPTTWDDTKVLAGEIGEYAIVARRKGNEWYVGGITNNKARELTTTFDFLDEKKEFRVILYQDKPDGSGVMVEYKKVSNKDKLSLSLLPSGGFAIRIQEI